MRIGVTDKARKLSASSVRPNDLGHVFTSESMSLSRLQRAVLLVLLSRPDA